MTPEEVPQESVTAFCLAFWGAHPVELIPDLVDKARETLAAALPEAERHLFAARFGTPEEFAARSAEAARSGSDDIVALCEKAQPGEHERLVRARVAEDLRRAAAGRRDYASRAPEHMAAELETEALCFETAARAAENPRDVMWGLLPADMWTDADRPSDIARGEAS